MKRICTDKGYGVEKPSRNPSKHTPRLSLKAFLKQEDKDVKSSQELKTTNKIKTPK